MLNSTQVSTLCLKGDAEMHKVVIIKILKVGIILSVLSFVSACGQKGDLYLPPESTSTDAIDFSSTV
ncbi:MAG: LPS translocon maturation chaperone LptM [Gammaproteobacteria bacterium]